MACCEPLTQQHKEIIAKVVSDHSRTLAPLAEFLSGRQLPTDH